jgi:hypothetical protein
MDMVKVILLNADQESHTVSVPSDGSGGPSPMVVKDGGKMYVRQFAAYGGIFMYTEASFYEVPAQ